MAKARVLAFVLLMGCASPNLPASTVHPAIKYVAQPAVERNPDDAVIEDLRVSDWFAAIASEGLCVTRADDLGPAQIAEIAYLYADAMIVCRGFDGKLETMTARDWFAGSVLEEKVKSGSAPSGEIASSCYEFADAMLARMRRRRS